MLVPRPTSFKVRDTTRLLRAHNGHSRGTTANLNIEITDISIILQDIATKLKKGLYATIEDVETEFALMAHNARMYNLDTSPVFAECESLREEFHLKTAKIREHFNLPDPPPFVVDINLPIPEPVLLDEYGVNIAIFTPPGVRPPLPERTRGYIIYNTGPLKPSSALVKPLPPRNGDEPEAKSSSSNSNLVALQQLPSQKSTPVDQAIKKRPGPKPKRNSSADALDALDSSYSPEKKKSRKEGPGGKEEKLFLSLFIPKKISSASNSTDGVESVSSSSSNTVGAEKSHNFDTKGAGARSEGGSKLAPKSSKVKLKGMGRWPV